MIAAVVGIALVAIYGIGAGLWVSNNSSWYLSLNRPDWQPPDWIFGLIWPYNFIILGVSAYAVSKNLPRSLVMAWLVIFALSVIAALLWSYLFYVPHNLMGAAIALPITALLTIPLLILTFRASVGVGIALIPYQLWVIVASSLAIGYAIKN